MISHPSSAAVVGVRLLLPVSTSYWLYSEVKQTPFQRFSQWLNSTQIADTPSDCLLDLLRFGHSKSGYAGSLNVISQLLGVPSLVLAYLNCGEVVLFKERAVLVILSERWGVFRCFPDLFSNLSRFLEPLTPQQSSLFLSNAFFF